ncbi:MAG: hypothetical protein ACI9OJ_004257 [Myxococcota bacterium]|jgi:hypothetical protein
MIATVIGVGPLFGFSWWAAGYVTEQSTSASVDLLLITLWMFLALGVAYLAGLTIADRFFPAGWREINILGMRPDVDKEEAELQIAAASRSQAIPFAFIVTTILAVLVVSTYFSTDGFLSWYARYGYATSTMRGDDPERQVAILAQMTRAQDDRLIRFAEMMEAALDDTKSHPKVREQAIWSLGEVSRRMVRSIELMEQGKKGADWVYGLHEHLSSKVGPKLVTAFAAAPNSGDGPALVYALGALRVPEANVLFRQWIDAGGTDKEMLAGIIRAAALHRDPRQGVELLRPILVSPDDDMAALAAWGIGEIYGVGTGAASEEPPDPAMVQLLSDRLLRMPFKAQCATLDALVRVRAVELGPVLFTLFDSVSPPERRCPRQIVDRPFQAPMVISKEEELREKVVQAIAAIAEGNATVMSWLRRRLADPTIAKGLHNDMRYILDVLSGRVIKG